MEADPNNNQNLKILADESFSNIVEMGLTSSSMIRFFKAGTKEILHKEIIRILPEIANSDREESFCNKHNRFCTSGIKNFSLAEKKRHGKIIKSAFPPSYGQVAKILDTVLKFVIYNKKWPDERTSKRVGKYLNAVVDTKIMMSLKSKYPDHFKHWPLNIENVDEPTYKSIQKLVRQIIKDEGQDLMPVQFDDFYRDILNRRQVCHGPRPPIVSNYIRRSDKKV